LMDDETKFYKSRRLRIAIESGNYQTQSNIVIFEDLENFWNLQNLAKLANPARKSLISGAAAVE